MSDLEEGILSDIEKGNPVRISIGKGWAVFQKNKDTGRKVYCGVCPEGRDGAFGFGNGVMEALSYACRAYSFDHGRTAAADFLIKAGVLLS